MAHIEQIIFCTKVRQQFPDFFINQKVLDVGSLDINGNNRYLFEDCSYLGIDVGEGNNVDLVCLAHEYNEPDSSYDIVISTECFEHDCFYDKTIKNIIRLLKSRGLFIFTCATTDRPEHGTTRTSPQDAPLLSGDWSNYYKNLTEQDIRDVIDVDAIFDEYKFEINTDSKDLYFYGIKR